jgi:hypothetical protein
MTLKTLGMGAVKFLKTVKKKHTESWKKASELDLKKIHDKYFDKSGMKQKGKDIVKEGLKGLKK